MNITSLINYAQSINVANVASLKKQEIIFNTTDRIDELHEEIVDKSNNRRHIDFYVFTHPKKMRSMADELKDIVQVEKVHYHQIDSKPSKGAFHDEVE